MKKVDHTGKVFGKLTVVRESDYRKSKKVHWVCSCECGTTTLVSSTNLMHDNTTSCGCSAYESRRGSNSNLYRGGMYRAEINRYKKSAEQRGFSFDLTNEDAERLMKSVCVYSGTQPKPDQRGLVRNGIDRVDSTKGYTKDNCVAACSTCNMMKRDMPYETFIEHINRIYQNLSGKKFNRA